MACNTSQRNDHRLRRLLGAVHPGCLAVLVLGACVPAAQETLDALVAGDTNTVQQEDVATETPRRSAVGQRRMDRPPGRAPGGQGGADLPFPQAVRSIDGVGNNLANQEWGAVGAAFNRIGPAAYVDGVQAVDNAGRVNARAISTAVFAQAESIPNRRRASDFLWQWGQFLDHDITETPVAEPAEPLDIRVPAGDPWFDPDATGVVTINLDRSAYVLQDGVRQQFNVLTAFIDASNVYGSDAERAAALRTLDGTGRLKTSAGDLLPFNTEGLPNAPDDSDAFFVAGDIRANEQVGLTAMHTLFVREHNRHADRLRTADPNRSGEEIYQAARALVAAEMQAITYREFLPALLGPDALAPYAGYRAEVNPALVNEFATAAYRFGHSMLSPQLLRVDADGVEIEGGHLPLAAAFFVPQETVAWGIEPVLRGLAGQVAQRVDAQVIDDVRNFLFGPPGAGGFDLVALNIQRGRDHGLPTLNAARTALRLAPHATFADLSSDADVQGRLAAVYASVDEVDLWVGGLAEDHVDGALVGETVFFLLVDQFERLRDGDRFWYQRYFPPGQVRRVEDLTLAEIIRRNTGIDTELPDDVFHVSGIAPVEVQGTLEAVGN